MLIYRASGKKYQPNMVKWIEIDNLYNAHVGLKI